MAYLHLPRISLVTPSFNQASYLGHTLSSVLDQQYPNLEYIVIDGGSTDGSIDVIKGRESQLYYWHSEVDKGHGDALNRGFEISTGDIMGWINSDDMLTPWSLKTIAEIFQKFPHVSWIQGCQSWWNERGQMLGAAQSRKNIYDYLLGDYQWIQQESTFWRRSLWERSGAFISDRVKYMVDGELWSRFFLYDELYSVECILAGFRMHTTNRSRENIKACHSEMKSVVEGLNMSCDSHIKYTADSLRRAERLVSLPLVRHLFKPSIARKVLSPLMPRESYNNACYKCIAWDVDARSWQEKFLPFR